MKRIARLLSLILIVTSLFSASVSIASAALTEEDAARLGAEVFEAWDVINYSSYEYMVNDYVSPHQLFVKDLEKHAGWEASLNSWRVFTFDLASEISYNLTEEAAYYNVFLFNILYDSDTGSTGTSFISGVSDGVGDAEATWNKIGASAWSSLAEANEGFLLNPKINDLDSLELTDDFMRTLRELGDVQESMSMIGDVSQYLGYCETVLDAVEKISKIEVLLQNSTLTADVLFDMRSYTGNDVVLNATLQDFHDMLSGAFSQEYIAAIFAGQAAASTLAEEMAGILWDEIIASSPLGLVQAGQKVGKFTADSLFNSSSTIACYYKLKAMTSLESCIRNVTKQYQQNFEYSHTPENAKKFLTAYKLLYKTYLEGLSCAEEFVDVALGEGLWNEVTNQLESEESKNLLQSIENIRKSITFTLDHKSSLAYNHYRDVLEYLSLPVSTMPELPVIEIVPELELDTIKMESFILSNPEITKDFTLTEDLTTYGSLTISGSTLDLNGHTLTVKGDVLHSGGTILLNNGTLDIKGDYRIQDVNYNNGEPYYTAGYGHINMLHDNDRLIVGKNLYVGNYNNSYDHGHILSAGRIELHGGLTQINTNSSRNFITSGSNIVAFVGFNPQDISFDSAYSSIDTVELTLGNQLTWTGNVYPSATTNRSVISISENKITGVKPGTATVTFADKNSSATFQCKIVVLGTVSPVIESVTPGIDGVNILISDFTADNGVLVAALYSETNRMIEAVTEVVSLKEINAGPISIDIDTDSASYVTVYLLDSTGNYIPLCGKKSVVLP